MVSTTLSPDEVMELLSESISPKFDPILNPLPNSQKFQGSVSEKGFRIRATSYYRGSLTYIRGEFISAESGVKIDMYVEPNPIFLLFPLFLVPAILGLLGSIVAKDYAAVFGSMIAIMSLILWPVSDIDNLDWFIVNLIGLYIVENKV